MTESTEEKVSILLVEDVTADARLIELLLTESYGAEFSLTHVTRVSEAEETLAREEFDVVLLDLTLPDANRLTTVEKVRASARLVPIVVLTAHDEDGLALQTLREGAQDYVTKSDLQASTLRRSIRYAIERQNAEIMRSRDRSRYLLAAELASARRLERKRLAGELHDYLAQILAAAKLKVDTVPQKRITADERTRLEEVKGLLRDALDYTRTLVADLNPTILRASGLAPALGHLAATMANHGLEVKTILADDDFMLEGERAELVYQSVRELLFNVVKHANATAATVVLRVVEGDVEIAVTDSGKGFQPEAVPSSGHFGLQSVRDRAVALQGRFEMETAPGSGTRAVLRVPIATDIGALEGAAT